MIRHLLVLAFAAAFLPSAVVPAAIAAERPPKIDFNGAIEMKAANGFGVFGLIASFEGKAQVTLIVGRAGEEATYTARGVGTVNSVDVDFGALGKVDLEVVPTGKDETVGSGWGGKTTTVPGSEFVGTLEFHGEEGFTEFSATNLPLKVDVLARLVCGSQLSIGTTSGYGVEGVALGVKGPRGLSLLIQQNHRGAKVLYEASLREKEGTVQVSRSVKGHLPAGVLRYAPSLETASFAASSPFTGSATYAGRTPPSEAHPGTGAWRGSLRVDFPGHAAVPLAGSAFKATIVHAHRTETRR